jgi:hypothetical protein
MTSGARSTFRRDLLCGLAAVAVCTLGGCVGPGLEPPGRSGQSDTPNTAGVGAGGSGGAGSLAGAGSNGFGSAGTTGGGVLPNPPTAGTSANGSAGVGGSIPGRSDDAGVDHDDAGATH